MRNKIFAMFVIFALFVSIFAFALPTAYVSADATAINSYDDIEAWFGAEYQRMMFDGENVRLIDRTAGTIGEKQMAQYLEERMIELGYEPIGRDEENPSFEYFEFTSSIDGSLHRSQNVMFLRRGTNSAKKIVICTSYDNAFGFVEGNESLQVIGADASTNNILTALSLAYQLSMKSLNFDVEVVFFGAGYHDYAGSKFFTIGLDQKEVDKILVAINVDDLSDDSLFFYDKEGGSSFGDYISNHIKENTDFNLPRYSAGTSVILSENEGLPYSHRALFSDNVSLISSGVRTFSVLSTSKTGVLSNEYFTKSNNVKFVAETYPDSFMKRAADLSLVLSNAICSRGFADAMTGSAQISVFWTNEKIAAIVSVVVLVLICIVYILIYYYFIGKMRSQYSYGQAKDEIKNKIDKQIDESGNPELMVHKNEIQQLYEEDLGKKFNNKQPSEGEDENC